jgi:ribose/xylose/arabinose/galactoside ABC-type transport system permease subunit
MSVPSLSRPTHSAWFRLLLGLLDHLPWLLSGLILLAMVLQVEAFQRPRFWLGMAEQYFAPALLALALTPIVLTGGIDLSVGSVAVFVSVVIAALHRDAGWPIPAAFAAGILAGLLAGLVNGGLVVVGVVPLVATLATRELFRGLALSIAGDTPVTGLPDSLGDFWRAPLLGLPLPGWGILLLFGLTYLLVQHTWVGRALYAIGDNETAARFAGVPVQWLKLGLYAASGLVAGLCGAGLLLRFQTAKANAETTLELTAISCVVLGGIRITGGSGHVAGTLLGIVTVATLLAGLNQVSPNVRDVILGGLLIAVAVSNEAARRWSDRLRLMDED